MFCRPDESHSRPIFQGYFFFTFLRVVVSGVDMTVNENSLVCYHSWEDWWRSSTRPLVARPTQTEHRKQEVLRPDLDLFDSMDMWWYRLGTKAYGIWVKWGCGTYSRLHSGPYLSQARFDSRSNIGLRVQLDLGQTLKQCDPRVDRFCWIILTQTGPSHGQLAQQCWPD